MRGRLRLHDGGRPETGKQQDVTGGNREQTRYCDDRAGDQRRPKRMGREARTGAPLARHQHTLPRSVLVAALVTVKRAVQHLAAIERLT